MDNYDNEEEKEEEETQEETPEETQEEETEQEEEQEEEQVDWKARALKAEQAIIRAKAKPVKQAPKTDTKLSTFDLLALQNAKIETEEDLEEVLEFANWKKIPVAEALKSNLLKATLAEKAEQRNSALAVNTGTGRRASGQVSDERLVADASKGILPDSDADLARLTLLQLKKKRG